MNDPRQNLVISLSSQKLAEYLKAQAAEILKQAAAAHDRLVAAQDKIGKPETPASEDRYAPRGDCQDAQNPGQRPEQYFSMEQVRHLLADAVEREDSTFAAAQSRVAWINFVAESLPAEALFELQPYELSDFINGRSEGLHGRALRLGA